MESVLLRKESLGTEGANTRIRMRDSSMEGEAPAVSEAGTYARFTYTGKRDELDGFYNRIFTESFHGTKYSPGSYALEVSDAASDDQAGESVRLEIWVPVTYHHPPHCGGYNNSWTTAAQALREAIKFTDKRDLTLVDVMGYTGHAFRINIQEENVDVGGPTAWDWGPELVRGLRNLGIRASYMGEPNYTPPTPELLRAAIQQVQHSIDKGVPAIAWDLFVPEFGVIFGYDDEKLEFHAKDVTKEGSLPYQKLGRGQVGELFVLTLDEMEAVTKRDALVGALTMITEHARIRYHKHPEPPFYNGLAGYDAWIRAFRSGKVDPFGNAYNSKLILDSRAYAVQFLKRLQPAWSGDSEAEREISRLAGIAADHYQAVFDALLLLHPLYPFPQGGNPNEPANVEYSIAALELAKSAETRGVEVLERMLAVLTD